MADKLLVLLAFKALSAKERKKADAYAGPDETFPLYANGDHLAAAWDLAGHAADPAAVRSKILAFAHEHGLTHLLPETAVSKAEDYAEVEKSMTIAKAWQDESGNVIIEGWISTNMRDIEKDVVQPEAFREALPRYMALGGPLSYEHRMQQAPIGHVQRAALVRDGRIFSEVVHPSDPADFQHFPANGTGVYGRCVVNDATAGSQVMKGNVRGFSWTGRVKIRPLPDGGREFTTVEAMRETTIAAYPINPTAAITAASKEL